MQITKSLIVLSVAAGFASVSLAQGTAAPAPQAAQTAKIAAPAPVAAEKKVETPKVAEPAKVEATKTETAKTEAAKPVEKHTKAKAHKAVKHQPAAEGKAESKPAAPAAAAK